MNNDNVQIGIVNSCDKYLEYVVINGEKIKIPDYILELSDNRITMIDDTVYINKYQYIKKSQTWKKTLKALYHYYF